MRRDEALDDVKAKTMGPRAAYNGPDRGPAQQLAHANLIKEVVNHRSNKYLNRAEIEAIDMICTKLSRISTGTPHEDNWLDIIGYASIGVEARHDEGAKNIASKFAPEKRTGGEIIRDLQSGKG